LKNVGFVSTYKHFTFLERVVVLKPVIQIQESSLMWVTNCFDSILNSIFKEFGGCGVVEVERVG
jgi:hypothetical protein